jgi:hypothetical protein
MAKAIWRAGYHELAVAIGFGCETQFLPVDLRAATIGRIAGEGPARHFPMNHTKTGRASIAPRPALVCAAVRLPG